jgi:starch synthase
MERARPVIASAVGGLPEIVADGETGLIVPSANADALAEAIVVLAGDLSRASAMGSAGRERALALFTPEQCARQVENLYNGALRSAPES